MSGIFNIRRTNLRRIVKELGPSGQRKLAETIGRTESYLSQIIGKNPTTNIGEELARKTEEKLNKPEGWLDLPHDLQDVVYRGVPIVGDIDTGPLLQSLDGNFPDDLGLGFIVIPTASNKWYGLLVNTSKYSPRMREGEAVIVMPDIELAPGQDILIKDKNDAVTCAEFLKQTSKKIWCNSLDSERKRFSIERSNIEIFHAIGAVARLSELINSTDSE